MSTLPLPAHTTHWALPPSPQATGHTSLSCPFHLQDYNPTSASPNHYTTRGNGCWWQVVWPLLNHILSDNKPNTINSSESAAEVLVTFVDALSPVPQQGIIAVCMNPCLLRPQWCLMVTDRIKRGLD